MFLIIFKNLLWFNWLKHTAHNGRDVGSSPARDTFSLGGIGRHVGLKIQSFFKGNGSSPLVII